MSYNGQTSDWNSYRVMLPPVGNTASIQVVQLTAAEAAAVEAEMQTQSATGSETTTDDSSEDFFSTF